MKDFLIEIPNDNPFKNDEFGRQIVAENFMNIFEKNKDGIVVSIDSDWGTGKTTFIRMWETLINNDIRYKHKFDTIYFNAWENDYTEDPLLSILAEIEIKLDSFKEQENLAPEIMKEICSPLLIGMKRIADIALKLYTAGAIGVENFRYNDDETQKEILEKLTEVGNDVLNRAKYAKKLRDDFKTKLNSIQQKQNRQVIFFIDELDRCRPTFAIELLETIKHIFNVPSVIFVISLDKRQLAHSVGTVYGEGMDSNGYLRRFFDIDYKLPNANRSKYMEIKNKDTLNGYFNTKSLEQFLDGFIIGYKFSLRDIDKMHKYMAILMPVISEYKEEKSNRDQFSLSIVSYLYAYLIALKIKKPNLFNKIMNYEYVLNKYNEELELNNTYNIKFVKAHELEIGFIRPIQGKAINYFLTLSYLSEMNLNEFHRIDENAFNLQTDDNRWRFNMVHLFDIDGHCDIRSNMEFMNNFQ